MFKSLTSSFVVAEFNCHNLTFTLDIQLFVSQLTEQCATSCAIRTLLLSSQEFDQQIQNTQDVIMFLVQVASPVPDWRGQTSGLGAGPSRAKLPPPGLAAPPGFQNSSAAQHLPPNNLGKIS